MYIDSHSHWSDPRFSETEIRSLLEKSRILKITEFMLGGVDPADWQRQIEIHKIFEKTFHLCFGLHPYFVSKNSNEECESALDQLAHIIIQSRALGETGLDFRDRILGSGESTTEEVMARQIEFFENQLELSKVYKKPIVLHIVQAHEKAFQIFEMWGAPTQSGMVHAFTGSYETAKKYIDMGLFISVGGAVTFDKNHKLHETLRKIPLESLLLESDSPDQPPQGWIGLNDSSSLWQIAESVGKLRNQPAEIIMKISTDNFKKLFSL